MAGGETFIVLADGTIVGPTNPMPMSGTNVYSTDVAIHDGTTATQHLAIDPDGRIREGAGATVAVGQITAALTATVLKVVNAHRSRIVLSNISDATIYIGPTSGVTTGNGFALPSGAVRDFSTTSALYCISAAGGKVVTFFEEAA